MFAPKILCYFHKLKYTNLHSKRRITIIFIKGSIPNFEANSLLEFRTVNYGAHHFCFYRFWKFTIFKICYWRSSVIGKTIKRIYYVTCLIHMAISGHSEIFFAVCNVSTHALFAHCRLELRRTFYVTTHRF